MKYLWVTGMFRSGTTLMAKIFDAHPDIAFASDPYRPYFNDLRDTIAGKNGLLKNDPPHLPLSDYFCDDEQLAVMRLIQAADMEERISPEHLEDLKIRIRDRGMEFSPFVAERVKELKGGTYRELFHSMMSLIREAYGTGKEDVVGAKEVWCNEFSSVLIRNIGCMKVINVVRDPRAVCASRNIVGEKYPWLFLARQWRKLAIFTWLFSRRKEFRDSFMSVKYEDLIKDPEKVCRKMCDFIGVGFSADMIDGSKFRDGDGSAWSQNSSYGKGKEISAKFSEKWRTVLTEDEIRLIEMLCYNEMRLFGYEPVNDDADRLDERFVYDPLIVSKDELAGWIRPLSDCGPAANFAEMSKEMARGAMLRSGEGPGSGKDIIESLFINKEFFDHARKTTVCREKV